MSQAVVRRFGRRIPSACRRSESLYEANEVRRLFDDMSSSYDRMNIVMSLGFSAIWRRQVLGLVGIVPSGGTILDLMSGRGETWSSISRRFPDASIAAVDFSERMVAASEHRNQTTFDGNVTVLCEDALSCSVPDASVDAIVSAYGLKTFDRTQSAILAREVARMLRPGGTFAFIDVTEPRKRLLRFAYRLYLGCIVPIAGMLLLSDPTEYRMLHHYLADYGDGGRSVEAFSQQGSLRVETRRHFFGCATSVYGERIA